MLEDQQDTVSQIIPHIHHLHARVGYEHGPQVNDPFAPEWNIHLTTFIGWWQKILNSARTRENEVLHDHSGIWSTPIHARTTLHQNAVV